jgi:hypothetical protein
MKTMTDDADAASLLEENRLVLSRLAERHDLSRLRTIEIGSRYQDSETAMAAREHILQKYGRQDNVIFCVAETKYSADDEVIDLRFDFRAIPNAELITKYELMLRDAAEKFGGETPYWEIAVK